MHYYQFNIADYQSHTRHLTPIEDICYRRMLDWIYLHEKPLPKEAKSIARILILNECLTDVEQVLNEFFTLTEHGYINVRAMSEIDLFNEKLEKASKAGKASAEARKDKIKQTLKDNEQTLNERSTDVQPNKKQEPLTNNQVKNNNAKKIDFFAGIPEQLIFDYKSVRKAKRACDVNETVFNGLVRESKLAGITLEQALTVCVERNWVGFKAEWYIKNNQTGHSANNRESGRHAAAKSIFTPANTTHLMGNKEKEVNDATAITN